MFGFLKGKMKIKLSSRQYSPGDTIEGTVSLYLKEALEAKELVVRLKGEETITTTDKTSGESSSRTTTVFDFEQPLDGQKVYDAKALEYPFTIKLPQDILGSSGSGGGGIVGSLLNIGRSSRQRSRVSWKVSSRLKMKGFDVSKSVRVNIA